MSEELIPAAVLIALLLEGDESDTKSFQLKCENQWINLPSKTKVLLTVRTHTVEHHKGQISFPGGAYENSDQDLKHTALRESQEEVGLDPSLVNIVAELPELPTVATRFRVKPFVGLVKDVPAFAPNPDEIGQLLIVPLSHLIDPKNSKIETFERNSLKIKMRTYYFDDHRIWGVTGRILQTLLESYLKTG